MMNLTGLPRASVNMHAIPMRNNKRLANPRTQLWREKCYRIARKGSGVGEGYQYK